MAAGNLIGKAVYCLAEKHASWLNSGWLVSAISHEGQTRGVGVSRSSGRDLITPDNPFSSEFAVYCDCLSLSLTKAHAVA